MRPVMSGKEAEEAGQVTVGDGHVAGCMMDENLLGILVHVPALL